MSEARAYNKFNQVATEDAKRSVSREAPAAILIPRYTTSALFQMGFARSYGASRAYRTSFTNAFVLAWQCRFLTLSEAEKPH